MDMCTCLVAVGGDVRNQVYFNQIRPVSFPEIAVLASLHGTDSVSDIKVCRVDKRSPTDERQRLSSIYGEKMVNTLYPGVVPVMEAEAPAHFPRIGAAQQGVDSVNSGDDGALAIAPAPATQDPDPFAQGGN